MGTGLIYRLLDWQEFGRRTLKLVPSELLRVQLRGGLPAGMDRGLHNG